MLDENIKPNQILKSIKGFKYPDIELVRWFFKSNLSELAHKKVLELGSHNGNNLSLFAGYDYECIGAELDEENVQNAKFNFDKVFGYENFKFFQADMRAFVAQSKGIEASVLLVPNVINYISKDDCRQMLSNLRKNRLYRYENGEFSHFFVRARSVKDYRYGKGKMVGNHSFILENDEFSGEKGLFCACYGQFELVRLLQDELNLFDFEVLESENLNSKANVFIKDSDIIVYGKIK